MRRIDPARNSNHNALDPGRTQPRRQPLHLNIENPGASLVASRRIRRRIRKALVAPLRQHLPAPRQVHREGDPPKPPPFLDLAPRTIATRTPAHPFLRAPLETDLRRVQLRLTLSPPPG